MSTLNTEGIEFRLSLKEVIGSGLRKLRSTSRAVFQSIGGDVDKLQKKLNDTAKPKKIKVDKSGIDDATRSTQKLNDELGKLDRNGRMRDARGRFLGSGRGGGMFSPTLGSLGVIGMHRAGGGFGDMGMLRNAGRFAATLGASALVAGGAGAGYAANAGLQGGAQKMSFQVMAGDQEGEQLYNSLTKYANQSIYGAEVYKNAQTQLAFGAPARDVMGDSKMLGDVAMGNAQRLESLTLAYSQVRAGAKLTGQDLLQFVNAGFNPLQEMSVRTGKSIAQLREDMSEGKITFDQVRKSFKNVTSEGGKFFRMTERMAETPYGKWEALKGQTQGVALQAGTVMAPFIGELITQIAEPLMNRASRDVEPFTKELIADFKEFIPTLKKNAEAAYDIAKPLIGLMRSEQVKNAGQSLLDFTASVMTDAKPAIEALAFVAKLATTEFSWMMKALSFGIKMAPQYHLAKYVDRRMNAEDPQLSKAAQMSTIKGLSPLIYNTLNPTQGGSKMLLNPDNWQNQQMRALGKTTLAASATNKSGGVTGDFTSGDDAISKGGGKYITMNFNAPLNASTYNVHDTKEAVEQGADDTAEQLLRTLNTWTGE